MSTDVNEPEDPSRRRALLAAGGLALLGGAVVGAAQPVAAAAGKTTVRLSLNENAYGASPRVRAAVTATLAELPRYVDAAQTDALIAQIAKLERVRPEQVVLGEVLEPLGLYLARQRPGGGNVVFADPGYTALVDSSAPLGGTGRPVPLDAKLENDLPALARAVDDATLAVSLINPHNPSGTVSDIARLDAFLREVSRRLLVVVDEAYLEYDEAFERASAVRLLREGANVLVFRTLAKAYGLAGLSIGYALAPEPLAAGLRGWGIGAPHSLSRPAIAAASAALADQAWVASVRSRNAVQRARLHAELERLGWRHTDSHANFVFFKPGIAVAELRKRFEARNIEIARSFPPLEEWIRVTVGTAAETDAVLAALRG